MKRYGARPYRMIREIQSASFLFQIDWEESTLLQRVCIRPHIDEELDNRKHVYNGIDAVLVSKSGLTNRVLSQRGVNAA
jgi:hypothetical protein